MMTYLKSLTVIQLTNELTGYDLKALLYNHLYKLIDRIGIAAEYADKKTLNTIIADQFLDIGLLKDIDLAIQRHSTKVIVLEQQYSILNAIGISYTSI